MSAEKSFGLSVMEAKGVEPLSEDNENTNFSGHSDKGRWPFFFYKSMGVCSSLRIMIYSFMCLRL